MQTVSGRFFVHRWVCGGAMASTMVQARGFVAGRGLEGVEMVHGGKDLLSERRVVAVGRAALGFRVCNAGGEALVKRWDGGSWRTGFWSHYGSLARGVSTSRVFGESVGESVGLKELLEESFAGDRVDGDGAAVLEVEAGESGSGGASVGGEVDVVVAEVDLAGNC